MNMTATKEMLAAFAREEDASQVIEYALIIAVVSIALVVALQGLTGTSFSGFITRVGDCLTAGKTCA
jgi:pilus assembly protein Flp/PilA